jgi:glucose-6-phosphate isomerase
MAAAKRAMGPAGATAELGELQAAVERRLAALAAAHVVPRLWQADVTVWKDDPQSPEIRDRLGWLRVQDGMASHAGELRDFAAAVSRDCARVVLLGMGGSSLAPEVFRRCFGSRPGFPSLAVLDSTDPRAVAAVEAAGPLRDVLFLVSSKSGTTLETDCLLRWFWSRCDRGAQFVAITDPDTPLARLAAERGFRRTFVNPPDIGGRYSALSYFGLVPAALLGLDPAALLEPAQRQARACAASVPAAAHPGAWLGAVLGEAARHGRDKLTFVLPRALAGFGLWVEQLIAESTGKEGQGIVPVVGEPLGPASAYGMDRLFVRLEAPGERDLEVEQRLQDLAAAGHPVLRLGGGDPADLGATFWLWEFATAVAGAVLRINAFDQPNVAESKTHTLGVLARGAPLSPAAEPSELEAFLRAVQPGDYVALLAYLPPTPALESRLDALRARLRDRLRVATSAGFGPRYLHSTGQLHKGGPPSGRFLVLTERPEQDVPVPGETWGFARLEAAQAEGDLQALRARGLPALRLEGLDVLERALGPA